MKFDAWCHGCGAKKEYNVLEHFENFLNLHTQNCGGKITVDVTGTQTSVRSEPL